MIKPVHARHHLVVYMPLKLLTFLIENKILHKWITYVIRDQTGIRTAPEIIRYLKNPINFKNGISDLFCWLSTKEDIIFWENIDEKWRKHIGAWK